MFCKFTGHDPFNQINQIYGQPVVLFPENLKIPGIFCSIGHTILSDAQPQFLMRVSYKLHSRFVNKFAIISTHLACVMWPNYSGANVAGAPLKFKKRKENKSSCVHVLHKTLNGDFTSLFFTGQQRNVPKFFTHVQSQCFAN